MTLPEITTPKELAEHMAELQYEAGMYQSLYENAAARIEALEAALENIIALDIEDWEMDVKMRAIARAALDKDAKQ